MPQRIMKRYGMLQSRQRLEKCGFHPAVTSKSLEQVLEEWHEIKRKFDYRPTAKEFWRGDGRPDSRLTQGFLMMRHDLAPNVASGIELLQPLEKLLVHVDLGPQMLTLILKTGRRSAMNLALASRRMLSIVTSNVTIWDSVAGAYKNEGSWGHFIDVAPDYTIGDVLSEHTERPDNTASPTCETKQCSTWKEAAIEQEHDLMIHAINCKAAFGTSDIPSWNTQGIQDTAEKPDSFSHVSETTYRVIRDLRPFPENALQEGFMWRGNPFLELPGHMPFEPTILFASHRLRDTLEAIYHRHDAIKVIHFHKTMLLDRRILAIVLRACPNVEMLGVYDCPLIHFGDVVLIVDLIHAINLARQRDGRPKLRAVDFAPCFEKGMSYQHPNAATYGLVWAPHELEPLQRGFFQIILEAYLKAKTMGLELLFEETGAFMGFLRKVPNTPFAVYDFLDAIHRYLDLDEGSPTFFNEKRKVLYDLFKPVRVSLEDVSKDWPVWYNEKLAAELMRCTICYYEAPETFFCLSQQAHSGIGRMCSKCIVRTWMDVQRNDLRPAKRRYLSRLFPEWRNTRGHFPAPILPRGRQLLGLPRPDLPMFMPLINEWAVVRPYEESWLNNAPVPHDSLQGLPTLEELGDREADGDLWKGQPAELALNIDLYVRAIQQLGWDFPDSEATPEVPGFPSIRDDGAFLGHPMMVQPPRASRGPAKLANDHGRALDAWKMMLDNGW